MKVIHALQILYFMGFLIKSLIRDTDPAMNRRLAILKKILASSTFIKITLVFWVV